MNTVEMAHGSGGQAMQQLIHADSSFKGQSDA